MKRNKISLFLVMILVLVMACNNIFAVTASLIDNTQKGSITITTREQNNGSTATTTAPVIQGVEYTLYRVDEVDGTAVTTVAQAEAAIASIEATDVKTTGTDGIAAFTNLTLGRYYAKVTKYPTGASQVPESFLVNVPVTNEAGTGWIYDITAQPKVKTANGNITLTKEDAAGETMDGVVFDVQISTDDGATWTNYTPEGQTSSLRLTTEDGQIELQNFPITYKEKAARYRFVEVSTPDDGYIIDNAQVDYFYVQADGKTIVVHSDGTQDTAADPAAITVTNEKPTVSKKVKLDDDTYGDQASAALTDTISYYISSDIPTVIADMTTFKLEDELPDGITNRTNVEVKAIANGNLVDLPTNAYQKNETGNKLTITYVPEKLEDYDTIVVKYDASLDMTKVTLGEDGNINTATLTYSNKISVDGTEESTKTTTDTATVVTGGVKIHKVNASNENLSGAKFKIATSQDNAMAGTFVKGTDGNDIEVTTGTDGYATINGLAYEDDGTARDYWLVETKAPTFEENGETKSYELLTKPEKVSVSGTSHTVDVKIINRKPIELPLTGGFGAILFVIAGASLIVIAKSIKKDEIKE